MKVADTNHVEMFATKSVTSPRQTRLCRCNGIRSVTMHRESWRPSSRTLSWINHESPRHDLCRGLSRFVSATKLQTLSQSWHNGIWALDGTSLHYCLLFAVD